MKKKIAIERKANKPETLREAQTWETNKNRYIEHGLCHKCACQAAWGHQIGFKLSHDPCDSCKVTMQNWPHLSRGSTIWRRWEAPKMRFKE